MQESCRHGVSGSPIRVFAYRMSIDENTVDVARSKTAHRPKCGVIYLLSVTYLFTSIITSLATPSVFA